MDVDCYALTTVVDGTITVVTSDGAGGCPGDPLVHLVTLGFNDVAFSTACGQIDFFTTPDSFFVCVEDNNSNDAIIGLVIEGTFTP